MSGLVFLLMVLAGTAAWDDEITGLKIFNKKGYPYSKSYISGNDATAIGVAAVEVGTGDNYDYGTV